MSTELEIIFQEDPLGFKYIDFSIYEKNIETLKKLSEQNHPLAQVYLEGCYECGIGVEIDLLKAFELYQRSVEQNHPIGQVHLGQCYECGIVVEKDLLKAFELYQKSAKYASISRKYLSRFYKNEEYAKYIIK